MDGVGSSAEARGGAILPESGSRPMPSMMRPTSSALRAGRLEVEKPISRSKAANPDAPSARA